MKKHPSAGLLALTILLFSVPKFSQAQIAYDNLTTPASAGTAYPNAQNPIFGDCLNLTQGGILTSLGVSLWNPGFDGNTGTILTGTTVANFYDNTVPYSGGTLAEPLLGSAILLWDFTAKGGLGLNYYEVDLFNLAFLNINLTQNILITQQFTQTSGTSTENGAILFGDPTVGSSPNTIYVKTSTVAAGLYPYPGNPYQIGYRIEIQPVPEPSAWTLMGLGLPALLVLRRRKS